MIHQPFPRFAVIQPCSASSVIKTDVIRVHLTGKLLSHDLPVFVRDDRNIQLRHADTEVCLTTRPGGTVTLIGLHQQSSPITCIRSSDGVSGTSCTTSGSSSYHVLKRASAIT